MTYPQYVVTLLLCLIAFVGYAMLLQDNLKEMERHKRFMNMWKDKEE